MALCNGACASSCDTTTETAATQGRNPPSPPISLNKTIRLIVDRDKPGNLELMTGSVFDNVLLEPGGHILPLAAHLDLGDLPNITLRGIWGFFLNHVLPPRPSKGYRGVVGWVFHKILVTAERPNSSFPLDLTGTGTGT